MIVMGIVSVYGDLTPRVSDAAALNYDTAYNSVSFALNVLLTLMIVIRLVLHNRNIRNTMGTSDRITRLYTTIVTMVVESYALYAIAFLLFMVPWAAHSSIAYIFSGLIGTTQVRTGLPSFPIAVPLGDTILTLIVYRSLLPTLLSFELPTGER